ncbi:MAG: hypothetical protein J6L62_05270 [Clostridia bacterium]|nr:hypothetical protein [Clostridia bacterium]
MKETIIKAIAAIVCVVIFCLSVSSAVSDYSANQVKVAEFEAQIAQYGGNGGSASGNSDGGSALDDMFGDSTDAGSTDAGAVDGGSTDAGTTDGGSTDAGTPNGGSADAGQKPAQLTKADVIKLINDETGKAAKGSYKLTRSGKFVKNIDVGNATSALNRIITGVDKNADLNSVVGGFLGIKKDPITGTVANGKGEGFDGKYMLKGMSLTEADVKDFKVSGNKYAIQIKNCDTPDANSALAHATNDYITFAEVNKGISDSVGGAVKVVPESSKASYTDIIFIATIVDGKITELEYSYTLKADLAIKLIGMNANGTGEADITGKYTNIKY